MADRLAGIGERSLAQPDARDSLVRMRDPVAASTDRANAQPATRSLLVFAFYYPPDNSSTGVLRTFRFTEHLLSHGWRSRVVSVPVSLYGSVDPQPASIPSGIEVERVWTSDVKRMLGVKGIYPSWLGFPDRYWPWLFSGTGAGARIIKSDHADAMYSTYPTPTAHLIALRLKRRFGLPWIADFRDPWAVDSGAPIRDRLEARLERAVVEAADRTICNTPAMRRHLVTKYPTVPESRFVTITNGYDDADFTDLVPSSSACFHILYPGVIDDENRNPRPLLEAVSAALAAGLLRRDDLLITFLGCGSYGVSKAFAADLERLGLRAVTDVVAERIPRRDAMSRMAGADVLVVLSDQQHGRVDTDWTSMQVPVKVYEYLRLGSRMLPLVSGGAVAELLREVQGAEPIAPNDTQGIARRLGEFYSTRRPHSVASDVLPAVERYSRQRLASLLADQLDALVPRSL